MKIYDLLSAVNVLFAVIASVMMFRLSVKRKRLRVVFGLVALFCLYCCGLYAYLLICAPVIGIVTAGLGRTGITLALASIIMLAAIIDR